MMPEVTIPDWDVLQQLPGYQVVLRSILKSQIKQLIEQLSSFGGEEAYLLSASVSDGALTHISSKSGEVFLNTHEQVKAEFLGFCMKKHLTEKPQNTTQQSTSDHAHPHEASRAKKRKLSDENTAPESTNFTQTKQRPPAVRCKRTTRNEPPSVILSVQSADGTELEQTNESSAESAESANEFDDDVPDDGADDFSAVPSVKEEDQISTPKTVRNKPSVGKSGKKDTPNNSQVVFSDNSGIVVKQEVEDTELGLADFLLEPQPTTSGVGAEQEQDMAVDDADEDFKPEEDSDSDWDESVEKTTKKKVKEDQASNVKYKSSDRQILDFDRQVVYSDNTCVVVKQEPEDPEYPDSGSAGIQSDPKPTTSEAGVCPGHDLDDNDKDIKLEEDSDSDLEEATEKTKIKTEATGSTERGKKQKCYDAATMEMAIEAVRTGMTKLQAARLYGVPRTTLIDNIESRIPPALKKKKKRPVPELEPNPLLSLEEEKSLVDFTNLMGEMGYPLNRRQVCLRVKFILDAAGRTSEFQDNLPPLGWFNNFRARNPDFSERKQVIWGYTKEVVTKAMITDWYDGLKKYLETKFPDHQSLVEDPRRMFNADECGFPICVNTNEVFAPKVAIPVYQKDLRIYHEPRITVTACLNAAGDYMPPLIIYPDQCFPNDVLSGFEEAIYGHTEKGWMDAEHVTAFVRHFNDFVMDKNIPKPVLLFINGHCMHLSFESIRYCKDNGIILYCILEFANDILQACDIGLLSPMKLKWKKNVKRWLTTNLGELFTTKEFPEVFKATWDSVCTKENSASGFKRARLFPLKDLGT